MLTLDERGGEESGVEVYPECVYGLPQSAGMPSRAVKQVLSRAQEQKTLAYEATRAVSRPEDGEGPVHLGNVCLRADGPCPQLRGQEDTVVALRSSRRRVHDGSTRLPVSAGYTLHVATPKCGRERNASG